jgi:hypothetical protein
MAEHLIGIAKIIGNLHSLEYVLRVFHFHEAGSTQPHVDLNTVKVGDVVQANAYTDYAQLRELINRYNTIVQSRDPSLVIPENDIVLLRDGLAHGRVWADAPGAPMRAVKFSPVRQGTVTVTFAETLTGPWLESKRKLLFDALQSVAKALPTSVVSTTNP